MPTSALSLPIRRIVAFSFAVFVALSASSASAATILDSPLTAASEPIEHLADWSRLGKYVVLMGTSPASSAFYASSSAASNRLVPMRTESGRRFLCIVPKVETEAPGEGSSTSTESTDSEAALKAQQRHELVQKLRLQTLGKCVERRNGYWSFELCPFVSARQLRREGLLEASSIGLGDFVDDYWRDDGAYVQTYSGGDDGREAKAVFECPPDSRKRPGKLVFARAEEPESFRYVFTLYADFTCEQTAAGTGAASSGSDTSAKALLAMLEGECIRLSKGWWSYEFCYEKHLRQYHVERTRDAGEKGGHEVTSQFILGVWTAPEDNKDVAELVVGPTPEASYFQQQYNGGDRCDLIGEARQAVVRFRCASDSDSPRLASVKETTTCSYLVEVETPSVCAHPNFKRERSVVHEIVCRPDDGRETRNHRSHPPQTEDKAEL